MGKLLSRQVLNDEKVKNILRNNTIDIILDDEKKVTVHLIYLPCLKDGESDHQLIFNEIKQGLFQHFTFSYKEIARKKARGDEQQVMDDLLEKAVRRLSQHTSKGELGELLLFLLIEVYLSAPKILSKISMKSSPRMPVFGADAVHGQFVKEKFVIYLGESKLHKDFKNAAYDAAKSIFTAKENFGTEFDLLDSYIDFPGITEELEEEILALLDPYNEENHLEHIHSPCFIGFTQPDILFAREDEYLQKYRALAEEYVRYFFKRVQEEKLFITEVTLLMLPFSCVDQLVDDFIGYFGIKK